MKAAHDAPAVVVVIQERRVVGVPNTSNRSEQRIPDRSERQAWSRRGVLAALGAVPAVGILAGCGGSADASEATDAKAGATTAGDTEAKTKVKAPTVTVTPADGTKKAGFASPVEVTVADGTLATVEVTGNDGSTLAGAFNDARTRWTSTANPYSGTKYTVAAKPQGATAQTATFTTKQPGETFVGYFTPEANSTSGVGMPVSINFTKAVQDRAAVEKAITVKAEPAV
jgi:hypothetical protein